MTRRVRTYTMQDSTALTTYSERTMEPTLEEQLRTRVTAAVGGWQKGESLYDMIDGIMRDVETYGVLRAREGYGLAEMRAGRSRHIAQQDAASHLPLPKHTRRVLREDPDVDAEVTPYPSEGGLRYRYHNEEIQWTANHYPGWYPLGRSIDATPARVLQWADLIANPFRTEEVPADESNPWGDE